MIHEEEEENVTQFKETQAEREDFKFNSNFINECQQRPNSWAYTEQKRDENASLNDCLIINRFEVDCRGRTHH